MDTSDNIGMVIPAKGITDWMEACENEHPDMREAIGSEVFTLIANGVEHSEIISFMCDSTRVDESDADEVELHLLYERATVDLLSRLKPEDTGVLYEHLINHVHVINEEFEDISYHIEVGAIDHDSLLVKMEGVIHHDETER